MRPDFTRLPSEITTNILSRLSFRSIAISKCVCKPWLHLLETDHFVKSRFAKSNPALAVLLSCRASNWFYVAELEEDGFDLGCRYDPLTRFDFSREAKLRASADSSLNLWGSANGLILLQYSDVSRRTFYVCNPITREFIMLPYKTTNGCGLGMSRISGQYKVVCVDKEKGYSVYTLGTGSWRRAEATVPFDSSFIGDGLFFHGNLHWMVTPSRFEFPIVDSAEWIYCFDLETECFSCFSVPLRRYYIISGLYTLRDSLSFCDKSPDGGGLAIWMMKEYGDEKSWSMEYVISLDFGRINYLNADENHFTFPMHVFKNGDVLMLCRNDQFMYYSKKTQTFQEIRGFSRLEFYNLDAYRTDSDDLYYIRTMVVTPSMVSLKCFRGMENVISF